MSKEGILKTTSVIIVSILILEILAGYYLYLKRTYLVNDYYISSIFGVYEYLDKRYGNNKNAISYEDENFEKCSGFSSVANVHVPKVGIYKGGIKYKLQFHKSNLNQNLNTLKDDTNFVILMLGGSELMGVTHKNRKIHVHLQELLRKKFNTKSITVINAGNSATKIKDEIYIYNDLKDILYPDMVILHTGANDALYFNIIKENERQKTFGYNQPFKGYAKFTNKIEEDANYDGCILDSDITSPQIDANNKNNKELLLENFNYYLDNMTAALQNQNVIYLLGIQGFNEDVYDDPLLHTLKRIQRDNPNFINFNEFNKTFSWEDSVHSTEKSAKLIAEIYFKRIMKSFSQDIEEIINSK